MYRLVHYGRERRYEQRGRLLNSGTLLEFGYASVTVSSGVCEARRDDLEPELLIAITDQVFLRGFELKRLAQLLDDPTARRMLRDVNVQDAPTIMTDDEEAVEHAERNRWGSEEIHGRDRFPMISKERQRAPGRARISRRSLHPTGDTSFGNLKTEHAEFPMDLRRSPGWVFNDHTKD